MADDREFLRNVDATFPATVHPDPEWTTRTITNRDFHPIPAAEAADRDRLHGEFYETLDLFRRRARAGQRGPQDQRTRNRDTENRAPELTPELREDEGILPGGRGRRETAEDYYHLLRRQRHGIDPVVRNRTEGTPAVPRDVTRDIDFNPRFGPPQRRPAVVLQPALRREGEDPVGLRNIDRGHRRRSQQIPRRDVDHLTVQQLQLLEPPARQNLRVASELDLALERRRVEEACQVVRGQVFGQRCTRRARGTQAAGAAAGPNNQNNSQLLSRPARPARRSALRLAASVAAMFSTAEPVESMLFRQDPGTKECFFVESMNGGREFQIDYEVNAPNDNLPEIRFYVQKKEDYDKFSPSAIQMSTEVAWKTELNAFIGETYAVCFESLKASGEQFVSVDITEGDVYSDLPAAATRAQKTAMLTAELALKVEHVRAQQDFALTREGFQRKIVADLNSHCLWWTAVEALCTVGFAIMQTKVLKGFFETKAYV
ncbi:unnamed protein product [Amoebophrya sp. A120]|nr:unnamed protein product [Amoebophrya sp. A120]|eukprot:GSA120T00020925001.1